MANTTWSTTDIVNGSLSGGNLVYTTAISGGVRTVHRFNTGKCYWEVTGTTWAGNSGGPGVTNPIANLGTVYTALANACGPLRSGAIWFNGSAAPGSPTLGTLGTGVTVGIALDRDTRQVWFRVAPSGNWNGNAGYAPGGTGGISLAAICPDAIFYPLHGFVGTQSGAGDVFTANFGDSAFSGAVPSGYTAGFPASSPTTVGAVTQAALEQWGVGTPSVQLTQMALEQWGSVATAALPTGQPMITMVM